MQLYLIRHAQSLNNARPQADRVEDPPLTELGQQQAAHLGEWIRRLQLTRLVTSPFLRALQTAEQIRKATTLVPEVQADLHEHGGCVAGPTPEVMVGRPGMTRSEISAQFPGFEIEAEIDGEGWWASRPYESEELARRRAARLIGRTRERFEHTVERVAYVMHGDFKRLFLGQIHRWPRDMPFNTSVTKIAVRPDEIRVESYNRVDHLPDDLVTA